MLKIFVVLLSLLCVSAFSQTAHQMMNLTNCSTEQLNEIHQKKIELKEELRKKVKESESALECLNASKSSRKFIIFGKRIERPDYESFYCTQNAQSDFSTIKVKITYKVDKCDAQSVKISSYTIIYR